MALFIMHHVHKHTHIIGFSIMKMFSLYTRAKAIHRYSAAQMQLDTRTRVTGKKDADKVGELMLNRRWWPSRFIFVTVRAPT